MHIPDAWTAWAISEHAHRAELYGDDDDTPTQGGNNYQPATRHDGEGAASPVGAADGTMLLGECVGPTTLPTAYCYFCGHDLGSGFVGGYCPCCTSLVVRTTSVRPGYADGGGI